ncbi:MAG: MBL fold metallo-hydrolase [Kiritimatiellae bacterium]|nr:MBL fold metallo-hydrolase [Kiritimatiellia bacterium]
MKKEEQPASFCKQLAILEQHPPEWKWQAERIEAFLALGHLLETSVRPGCPLDLAQNPNALWETIYLRLKAALLDVEHAAPAQGEWHLWQMYNAGVILKNRDVTVGVDLVPVLRTYGWPDHDDLTRHTATLIDFLLITHHHADHYDRALVRACLELGKPVCIPEDIQSNWERNPNLHVFRDATTLTLCDLEITGRRATHVWRETPEELPLIYYEITDADGHTMLFAGDADYTKDFNCTPGKSIDALFLPWRNPNASFEEGSSVQTGHTTDALKIVTDRLHPKHIILEHYAELEHVYQNYPASYDLAATLKKASAAPLEWMFWGEHMTLLTKNLQCDIARGTTPD